MRISNAGQLHKRTIQSTAGGRCFLWLAGLLCIFFASVFASFGVFAEVKYTPVDAEIPFVCFAVEDARTEYQISIKAMDSTSPVPD